MNNIKVLVVDDSAFMRKVIGDIIESDPAMTVIDKARDGQEALNKIKKLNPDVVTMDVEMPGLDGLSALENIMKEHPVPVVMLSSLTKNGAEQTVKALQLGAVDFIPKTSGQISLDIDTIKEEIIRKVKVAAGTRNNLTNFDNIKQIRPRVKAINNFEVKPEGRGLNKLIVIGTSTGGPKALHQVLPGFPANIDAAILIVQHMPSGFTKSLADRLNSLSQISVKEAEHGEKIVPGCAYIAPGDYHLNVLARNNSNDKELLVQLNKNPLRGGHRPAVDEMFESVSKQFWAKIYGVIMTGMGRDGTDGVKYIKEKGATVIAEHQSSCIVYGMPKSVVDSGLADKIVPLNNISEELMAML